MTTLRVKDSRKVWRVSGIPLASCTALDVKHKVKAALGLLCEAKHIKISQARGNEARPYREAVSDWADGDPMARAGLQRGAYLYVSYPVKPGDIDAGDDGRVEKGRPAASPHAAAARSAAAGSAAAGSAAAGSAAAGSAAARSMAAGSARGKGRKKAKARLPQHGKDARASSRADEDAFTPAGGGAGAGAGAGAADAWAVVGVPERGHGGRWHARWREDCPICGRDHTTPEPDYHTLDGIKRSLIERHMLGIALHGPNGENHHRWEFCEHATVGQLRECLADYFGLDVRRTHLEYVGARKPEAMKLDDTRLMGDLQGPELSRQPEIRVTDKEWNVVPEYPPNGSSATATPTRGGIAGAPSGPALSDMTFDASTFRTPDNEPLPEGIHTLQQLEKYLSEQYETVVFNSRAAVRVIGMDPDPFMNQSLQRRRFAWLLGTVTPEREVKVAAFYEPPQLGFTDHFLLHKDPNASLVDEISEALGLKCVGWLTTHKYRGKTPLTASEMLFQATRQKANPNFVMVKYVHDKDEEGRVYKEFTAYQVSEQCVKMVDGNTLRCDPGDPFRLYSAKKVKCVNPDTRNFEFTNKFDTEWMTALVGIQQERAELHAYFRPPNRVNKDGLPLSPLSVADLGAMFRQEYVAENFLGRLRDFNFLLYFATHRQRFGFAESEIIEMCHMVRTNDVEGAETFRSKIEEAVGLGYQCPVCKEHIDAGHYATVEELLEHVQVAHRGKDNRVVCPICSSLAFSREERTAKLTVPFDKHVEQVHRQRADRPHSVPVPGLVYPTLGPRRSVASDPTRDTMRDRILAGRRIAAAAARAVAGSSSEEDGGGDDDSDGKYDGSDGKDGGSDDLRAMPTTPTPATPPSPPRVAPPRARPARNNRAGNVTTLVELGFSRDSANRALEITNDLQRALDLLGEGARCPFTETCNEVFVGVAARSKLARHVHQRHS